MGTSIGINRQDDFRRTQNIKLSPVYIWIYVGDKIGFQVLARRNRLMRQGSVSRLECLGRVSFVGVAL